MTIRSKLASRSTQTSVTNGDWWPRTARAEAGHWSIVEERMEKQSGVLPRSRKWWLILIAVFVLGAVLNNYEPDWYAAEAETMERVSRLLNAPVSYIRGGGGFGSAYHVSRIVLPPVDVDRETARALAWLIRGLPECYSVGCAYVPNQDSAINALNEELNGHATATHDLGASSQTFEEMQRETYVAGIHRASDYSPAFPRTPPSSKP